MLKKKERLSRSEFNRFFSVGKRFHSPLFTIIYAPNPTFHASAVMGKKIGKTAVLRNKFRRRVYAGYERMHKLTPLTGVYIVIAKSGAEKASFEMIERELSALTRKSR